MSGPANSLLTEADFVAAKKEVKNAAKKLKTSGGNVGHTQPSQPKRSVKLPVL